MHLNDFRILAGVACLAVVGPGQPLHGAEFQIEVKTGSVDRRGTVVRAALPVGTAVENFILRRGPIAIPWQLDPDGAVSFALEDAPPGKTIRYDFSPRQDNDKPAIDGPAIDAGKANSRINFTVSGTGQQARPLMSYQAEPGEFPRADIKPAFKRGGYLHPILTPGGRQVTDDFPPNHVHHHGVWWAWTHTEFGGRKPDFWNMGDGKGRVEHEAVEKSWSGPAMAGFRARHRFVDLTSGQSITALHETWQVTAYAHSPGANAWMFDLVSEQHCATTNELRLPEYRYGGVGVRGNWTWNGKDKTFFLTANGETDREKGHATRARWCDMGGDVDGNRVGIAILDHPSNFRHPQPMRIHPTEPFFNYAPQQAGDMVIKPGEKYVSRYRFVIHDGPPDRAELDRLWNDFAHPPEVTVTLR